MFESKSLNRNNYYYPINVDEDTYREYVKKYFIDENGDYKREKFESELRFIVKSLDTWPTRQSPCCYEMFERAKCVVVQNNFIIPLYEDYYPWAYTEEDYNIAKQLIKKGL